MTWPGPGGPNAASEEFKKRIKEVFEQSRNECTANPFWAVVVNGPCGVQMLAGIWFNRVDAESHLEHRAYRYPKSAFVFCFSADSESHLAEMYDLAKAELLS